MGDASFASYSEIAMRDSIIAATALSMTALPDVSRANAQLRAYPGVVAGNAAFGPQFHCATLGTTIGNPWFAGFSLPTAGFASCSMGGRSTTRLPRANRSRLRQLAPARWRAWAHKREPPQRSGTTGTLACQRPEQADGPPRLPTTLCSSRRIPTAVVTPL